MTKASVQAAPNEPAYRITLVRMLVVDGSANEANEAIKQLEALNLGGRLDNTLTSLRTLPGMHIPPSHSDK
jgi:protein involved in temperature-dependent protein secretion